MALLRQALPLRADLIATPHHARIEQRAEDGRWLLRKGIDESTDQSHLLYTMTQDQLARTLLPMGECTRDEAHRIAGEMGLPVREKSDRRTHASFRTTSTGPSWRRPCPGQCSPGPSWTPAARAWVGTRALPATASGSRTDWASPEGGS
ncbi:MAG: hypothetical protein ACE5JM_12870 [Armatimonadota bacterium]